MSFQDFGFCKGLLQSIEDKGYQEASPIQLKAIPAILDGHDVLATAQTGTGKTAAFTLPVLQKIFERKKESEKTVIRALILTPTRELALQVGQSVKAYASHLPLKQVTIFGGVNPKPQMEALKGPVDILVATPGRLFDLSEQKALSLSEIEFFILDEADRMLDMGFINDILRILKMIPEKRQSLLFSATFSKEIKHLIHKVLNDPVEIKVAVDNAVAENVLQDLYFLDKVKKAQLLRHLILSKKWEQVLVFTRTKFGADRLWEKLQDKNISSVVIHGKKTQVVRNKALQHFKDRKVQVLVATDVAARGLDIKELPHVVNYDVPNVPEDYVHRIGRTGRAGLSGHSVTLVCEEELKFIDRIERLTDSKMTICVDSKFSKPLPGLKDGHGYSESLEIEKEKQKKKDKLVPKGRLPLNFPTKNNTEPKEKKPIVKKTKARRVRMKNPMQKPKK